MLFIDAATVHRKLGYRMLVEGLRAAHLQSMPVVIEAMMPEPGENRGRCLLSLKAWQADRAIGVKLVSVFPENRDCPSIQGVYIIFDGKSGAPLLVADGTALTLRKTAADSALGVDILARPDVENMLMVGAGALAPHVIEAIATVRPSIRRVRIWNRTPSRAIEVAEALRLDGIKVTAVPDLDGAVAWADVISSATMATTPLVQGRYLKPGTHIDLIGGWQPEMRESDDEAVRRSRIFTDSKELCRTCGDISQPVEAGVIAWSDIKGDLFDLCSGTVMGRSSADEITLYKNAGGAHLDLFTAQLLTVGC